MDFRSCRFFTGYKPCAIHSPCNGDCPSLNVPETRIVIVHLGAMGAVLRSTALLPMIKRKYPSSHVTWVTEDGTKPLLFNNPFIDRVYGCSPRDQLILGGLQFDIGFFIDKSPEIGGLQRLLRPQMIFGFMMNPENGAILPATGAAQELWELGLNNDKKFFENSKSEIQLVAEALELPYSLDGYQLFLTSTEKALLESRKKEWSDSGRKFLVGLNTGTSGVLPNKTLPISFWKELIGAFKSMEAIQFLLLGGPEETQRHQQLKNEFRQVQASPLDRGLRDGLVSLGTIDMLVTGDSLGLHMAIALEKFVVAWFGPTCSQEIELYGRGLKLRSKLPCAPCWKRECFEPIPCNRRVELSQVLEAVLQQYEKKRSTPWAPLDDVTF